MKQTGNTILITGGGSGIGAALAHRFHDLGNTVIVAGRRGDALDRAADGRPNMHGIALDIDDPHAIATFAAQVKAEHPRLNVLVNNAGIMRLEAIEHARNLHDAEATITTNLLGPIRLINLLVDHLAGQPDAAIVNVTSGLAFVPMVAAATYCATKAALHSYTISLREALKGRVEVIELSPPGVQTDLTPGQARRPGYMPLEEFTAETMALFAEQPTPREMPVGRARMLRTAEREGRFDETLTELNESARRAREAQPA